MIYLFRDGRRILFSASKVGNDIPVIYQGDVSGNITKTYNIKIVSQQEHYICVSGDEKYIVVLDRYVENNKVTRKAKYSKFDCKVYDVVSGKFIHTCYVGKTFIKAEVLGENVITYRLHMYNPNVKIEFIPETSSFVVIYPCGYVYGYIDASRDEFNNSAKLLYYVKENREHIVDAIKFFKGTPVVVIPSNNYDGRYAMPVHVEDKFEFYSHSFELIFTYKLDRLTRQHINLTSIEYDDTTKIMYVIGKKRLRQIKIDFEKKKCENIYDKPLLYYDLSSDYKYFTSMMWLGTENNAACHVVTCSIHCQDIENKTNIMNNPVVEWGDRMNFTDIKYISRNTTLIKAKFRFPIIISHSRYNGIMEALDGKLINDLCNLVAEYAEEPNFVKYRNV